MTSTKKTPTIFRRSRAGLPALLMAAICLAGCQTDNPGPAERSLPPAPGRLMRPVAVPALYKGEDARAALRLTLSALLEANARLKASDGWYQSVRKTYRGQ